MRAAAAMAVATAFSFKVPAAATEAELRRFLLDPASDVPMASPTNVSLAKKIKKMAEAVCATPGGIGGPDEFAAAVAHIKNVKGICDAMTRRRDAIEWNTPDGRPRTSATALYWARDWARDPPSAQDRLRFLAEAVCTAAPPSAHLNKSHFPIYGVCDGGAWFRYCYSGTEAKLTCDRIVEDAAVSALPAWLGKPLADFIAARAVAEAHPDSRDCIYLFAINDAINVPAPWCVQTYVGETAESMAYRWFNKRLGGHLKAAKNLLSAAAGDVSHQFLVADATIAACWARQPSRDWWQQNTRLYILRGANTAGDRKFDDDAGRIALQNEYIEKLGLTNPIHGMNQKGQNKSGGTV